MKKFLCACAAMLCVVLVYHVGARNAEGQAAFGARWVGSGPGSLYEHNGQLWVLGEFGSGTGWTTLTQLGYPEPPIPPADVLTYIYPWVVSKDGEAFQWTGTWTSMGVIPGGPTPAVQESWGGVKARYR